MPRFCRPFLATLQTTNHEGRQHHSCKTPCPSRTGITEASKQPNVFDPHHRPLNLPPKHRTDIRLQIRTSIPLHLDPLSIPHPWDGSVGQTQYATVSPEPNKGQTGAEQPRVLHNLTATRMVDTHDRLLRAGSSHATQNQTPNKESPGVFLFFSFFCDQKQR